MVLNAAIVAAFFASEKLGTVGILAQSMGVWWIVLFDMVMGSDTAHTRSVNFSTLLHCAKRALRAQHRAHPSARRPLVIIDHLDHALGYSAAARRAGDPAAAEAAAVRAMLAKLLAWGSALCFDEPLADVCVCVSPQRRRRRAPATFRDSEEFRRQLLEWTS